jgi:hypothetical protein
MKLYLIVANGKLQGKPVLVSSELWMMGSSPICQLRSQLPGVGSEHCVITNRDRKVFVRDLGSGETTLVNGEVLPPDSAWPLHAGDMLTVGPLEFMVQFTEASMSQKDVEEWALKCLDTTEREKEYVEDLELMDRKEKAINASRAAEAIIDRLNLQRGLVKGRLRVGLEKGVTVVRINDPYLVDEEELTLIEKELRENLSRHNLRVLLDFKNIRRCSTKAVQMIGDLATWLQPWGSAFAVCRIKPELRDTLRALPQLRDVYVFAEKTDALDARW